MRIHIGIDDTDSPDGGCTTYAGYAVAFKLRKYRAKFLDLPYLIRLNPNIPAKTRGNGAVSIHVDIESSKLENIVKEVEETVSKLAEKHGKTSPGVIIATGDAVAELETVYKRALHEYVPKVIVEQLLSKLVSDGRILAIPYAGRGIIGAAAAIGAFKLSEKFTYELIVYRADNNVNEERLRKALTEIDKKHRPLLFATYDYVEKRFLAIPGGQSPVALGLRGLDPLVLEEVAQLLVKEHGFREWIIYKTNQATLTHLYPKPVEQIHPYDSVLLRGKVANRPEILPGGHVRVTICDSTGCVNVMFYWETGRLRRAARLLREGDLVEVGGGVVPRRGVTINAEFLRVLAVQPLEVASNPLCPRCGARMKSAGREKGYKCYKCGYRSAEAKKSLVLRPRVLEPGIYLPSPRAYRHLTQPSEILGMSAYDVLPTTWISGNDEMVPC